MMCASFRAIVGVACLVPVAAAEAPLASVFDPPFAFPALKDFGKGSAPPTEDHFVHACFTYVYGLIHQGNVMKRPAALQEMMIKTCLQEDRKGCHRFAQQLENIVEAKEREGPIGGHVRAARAAKDGKPVTTSKVLPVEAPKPDEHLKDEKAYKDKLKPEAVAPLAKKVVRKHKPGARVKAVDREEEDKKELGLLDAQRCPVSYNNWCSNLYTVAIATYDPQEHKTPTALPSVAPAKASLQASQESHSTNTTNTSAAAKLKEAPEETPAQSVTKAQSKKGAETTKAAKA